MPTQESRQEREKSAVEPDMRPPESAPESPESAMPATEPVTPPAEPVVPPSEPVTPPSEPVVPPSEPGTPAPEPLAPPMPAEPGLEEKLAQVQAQAAELQEAFLRARAEVENLRRRAQEDLVRAHKFSIEGFAETLVPVKDSLEAALKVETASVDSYKQGVEMTLKQLSSAFEKNRLTEINPQPGEKFDPLKHQAISMVPAEQNASTIINVLQKGYMISDRLLRPALVTVAGEKRRDES